MKKPNPELAAKLKKTALDMLMAHEPEQISVRDVAKECGVTTAALYYYYKDKDALFDAVKLDCLAELDAVVARKANVGKDLPSQMRAALAAFRDWAFARPRIALLLMQRLPANTEANPETLSQYYASTTMGTKLLERAVREGLSKSTNPVLAANLCIAAVWGAVEAVICNRTAPEYWGENGVAFTDAMIDACCRAVFTEEKGKKE
jgi:AcrR family transcriptional regulator